MVEGDWHRGCGMGSSRDQLAKGDRKRNIGALAGESAQQQIYRAFPLVWSVFGASGASQRRGSKARNYLMSGTRGPSCGRREERQGGASGAIVGACCAHVPVNDCAVERQTDKDQFNGCRHAQLGTGAAATGIDTMSRRVKSAASIPHVRSSYAVAYCVVCLLLSHRPWGKPLSRQLIDG